jgi:hypothetical protein
VFKAITGGDRLTGELKYGDAFEFRPFVRLIFSANHFPAARYATQSYFDRWLLIPFERRFRGSNRDMPRGVLDARLSAPQELSGALNRALPALRRLRKSNHFSETNSIRRTGLEFEIASDPLRAWLELATVSGPSCSISQSVLHAVYANACTHANRAPITKQVFGRLLKKYRPNIREFQKTLKGSKQWMYGGIGLSGETSNNSIVGELTGHPVEGGWNSAIRGIRVLYSCAAFCPAKRRRGVSHLKQIRRRPPSPWPNTRAQDCTIVLPDDMLSIQYLSEGKHVRPVSREARSVACAKSLRDFFQSMVQLDRLIADQCRLLLLRDVPRVGAAG